MLRAPLRGHWPARLTFVFCAALASGAAGAQSLGGPIPYQPTDPWAGITIIISPAPLDPADETAAAPTAPPPRPADAPQADEPQIADTPIEHWNAPSLYESLELGLGTTPEPEAATPAPNQLLPDRTPVATSSTTSKLPTRIDFFDTGPASAALSTNMSASAPVSSALNRKAGGGNGEVKGRVGYSMDNLSLYGTGNLGASASTGAPSLYDTYAVGSSYQVPLDTMGLGTGEKLGATVEMNSANTVSTGVELRAPLGSYERYISVQRSSPADSNASGVVKAGVLGKF